MDQQGRPLVDERAHDHPKKEENSMNKGRLLIGALGMLLAFSLFSCAGPGREVRKKQGEASRNLGEAYMQEGRYTAALKELLAAEKQIPDDPYLQNDLGLTYLAKEKSETAIQHFKKAVKLNPDYAPARNNLGVAYMAAENWDAAITTFKEVSQDLLYATPHFPLTNMGWAYYNKGQFKEAVQYYQDALKIEPRFIIALRGLGQTYLSMKKYRDAIDTFEKAIDITPRFPPLYMDLGQAYTAVRDNQSALQTYKKVIALFPQSDFAEEAKKKVGEMSLKTGG